MGEEAQGPGHRFSIPLTAPSALFFAPSGGLLPGGRFVDDRAMPMLVGDLIRRNALVVPDRPAASLGHEVLTHAELVIIKFFESTLRDVDDGTFARTFSEQNKRSLIPAH